VFLFSISAKAQEQVQDAGDVQSQEALQEASLTPQNLEREKLNNLYRPRDKDLQGFRERITLANPEVDLQQMPSLFFTPSQQSLISEARAGFTARPPTESEIRRAQNGDVPKGLREVTLAGIVYLSAGDWTIWLNGQKVTPNRLPPEILDISVRKNSIKLKWFDAYTNQIFPIKLKTHQRFNIDTRIFLPG